MSQFIESIQLLQGKLRNLEFHQERFERTRREKLGIKSHPRLAEAISIPWGLEQGILKCRVSYAHVVELVEFEPHIDRGVKSLKLVYSDDIDYSFKYADRGKLETLYKQRGNCDDILVIKKGMISDSFYANVVFWDGKEWITPDTPLLQGTMRASLLNNGLIREESISQDKLNRYKRIKLINAMNDLHKSAELPIEAICK